MRQSGIPEVEVFDVWGIEFMGWFFPSQSNLCILVLVNYVSKWVEAMATPANDYKVMIMLLKKHIFTRFGTPRALLSDNGTYLWQDLGISPKQVSQGYYTLSPPN